MDAVILTRIQDEVLGRIRLDEPMNKHTSFKVGGPADAMVEPHDESDLLRAVRICWEHKVPFILLGAGFAKV